jgi:hypothetical protein
MLQNLPPEAVSTEATGNADGYVLGILEVGANSLATINRCA